MLEIHLEPEQKIQYDPSTIERLRYVTLNTRGFTRKQSVSMGWGTSLASYYWLIKKTANRSKGSK